MCVGNPRSRRSFYECRSNERRFRTFWRGRREVCCIPTKFTFFFCYQGQLPMVHLRDESNSLEASVSFPSGWGAAPSTQLGCWLHASPLFSHSIFPAIADDETRPHRGVPSRAHKGLGSEGSSKNAPRRQTSSHSTHAICGPPLDSGRCGGGRPTLLFALPGRSGFSCLCR